MLRSKDEGFEMFLKYKSEVENQLNKKIKRIEVVNMNLNNLMNFVNNMT